MRPPVRFARSTYGATLVVLCASLSPAVASAGQLGSGPAMRGAAPPVVVFPSDGISLEDAVALTLRHDPAIAIVAAHGRFLAGAAKELSGAFDLTLISHVDYDHRTQDLTSDRIRAEQRARDGISDALPKIADDIDSNRAVLGALKLAEQGPLSGDPLATLSRLNPALTGTLATFDALIPSGGLSAAARSSLQNSRAQFLRDAEATLNNNITSLQADFTTAQTTLARLGPVPTAEVFYDGSFDVGATKLLRNGVTLAPFFQGTYQGTNFKGKPRAVEDGGKGLADLFTFTSGLGWTLPLAKGRGDLAVASAERAAIIERDASQLSLDHQRSASALSTVMAYWNAKAALDAVVIGRDSVGDQRRLVRATETLVSAGELPRMDLNRARAAEAQSLARLADAERVLRTSRVSLAIAMGVGATGDSDTLPLPRDPFPPLRVARAALAEAPPIGDALGRRADLRATGERLRAEGLLEQAEATNLRPRLDLLGSVFFSSLGETSVARALDGWVGPSTTLDLRFEQPLGNHEALGRLEQRQADLSRRRIESQNLAREITLHVAELTGSLQQEISRVEQAETAVFFYRTTVDAERQRFEARESTLIDTVVTEQQQTDARLALNDARRTLAQTVARLRFETGRLETHEATPAADPAGLQNRRQP